MALSAEPQEIPQDFLEVAERASTRLRLAGEAEVLLAFAARNTIEVIDPQESVAENHPPSVDETTSQFGQRAAELVLRPSGEPDDTTEVEGIILEDPVPPKDLIEEISRDPIELLETHTLSDVLDLSIGRARFTEKQRKILASWAAGDKTQAEIGAEVGAHGSYITKTINAASVKLKSAFREEDGPSIEALFEAKKAAKRPIARPRNKPSIGNTQPMEDIPQEDMRSLKKYLARKGYSGDDDVSQYLAEIGRYPLLNGRDEEVELAKIIEAGVAARERLDSPPDKYTQEQQIADRRLVRKGDDAKRRFIESNLKLVVSIAKRYPTSTSLDLLDFIQEGNIGMEHAVDKFDWRQGFKFSTYATYWIRQAIGRALDQQGNTIRVRGDNAGIVRRLRRLSAEGSSDEEILEEMNISEEELAEMRGWASVSTSLDRKISDDADSIEIGDLIGDSNSGSGFAEFEEVMILDELFDALESLLDSRGLYTVKAYAGLITGRKMSFREIGEHDGVTPEAARRFHKKTIEALKRDAKYGGKMAKFVGLLSGSGD